MSIFGAPAHASLFHNGNAASIQLAGTAGVSGGISTSTGNLIVVFASNGLGATATLSSVTDSIGGNVYTILGSPSTVASAAGSTFVAYCLASTGTNAHNIVKATFGTSANTYQGISVLVIPLTGGAAAFDVVKFTEVNPASSNPGSAAFNTGGSDEEVYLSVINDLTGITYSANTGYTIAETGSGASGFLGTEYLTTPYTSPQTGITPSIHGSGSSQSTVAAVGFKAGSNPIAATITGVGSVTAAITGKGVLLSSIAGHGTVAATLGGAGALQGLLNGHGTVVAALTGTLSAAATIHGTASVVGSLSGAGALLSSITGKATVVATGKAEGLLVCHINGVSFVVGTLTTPSLSAHIQGRSNFTAWITIFPIAEVLNAFQIINNAAQAFVPAPQTAQALALLRVNTAANVVRSRVLAQNPLLPVSQNVAMTVLVVGGLKITQAVIDLMRRNWWIARRAGDAAGQLAAGEAIAVVQRQLGVLFVSLTTGTLASLNFPEK